MPLSSSKRAADQAEKTRSSKLPTRRSGPVAARAPSQSNKPVEQLLGTYQAKRNFTKTPEPSGANATAAHPGVAKPALLSFVVQKHWASRLHYDFRLELDGVLKSWAVPKGPSYDPADKRMAVQVEDHPLSYASFEGEIPPGAYGAGKVIVWDKGIWLPVGNPHEALEAGNLKFQLEGHKLRGKWALVRIKENRGAPNKSPPWLLIKEKDAFAKAAGDFSVVDDMPESVAQKTSPVAVAGEGSGSKSGKPFVDNLDPARLKGARKSDLPAQLSPQLATLVDTLPSHATDWVFEVKFDGYRLLARVDAQQGVQLLTRNGNDWTPKMPALAKALQDLALPPGWYDGEVVVLGTEGVPDFQALQQSFDSKATARLTYYLFDLPFQSGYDLRGVALAERRALLQRTLQERSQSQSDSNAAKVVRFSEAFDASAEQVFASACKLGLEGVIGKRRDALYVGRRSPGWIKLKCGQRQEFVIGGFTEPKGARVGLGSLLLGVYEEGALRYAGNVGTGFNDALLKILTDRLHAIEQKTPAFADIKEAPRGARWVEPTLVAEVSFGEWTQAGRIRHAVFRGLRTDKPATVIVRETAKSVDHASSAASRKEKARATVRPDEVRVTNPERVIDPASGLTKIELVRYYTLVADLMMPHLKDRPVALVRAPEGVAGELFFQKHADTRKLPGVKQLDPALYISHQPMLAIANAQGLQSIAQWNVIEVHTQNAVASSFSQPDRMVFDIDPGEGVSWAQIQEAAGLLRVFLGDLGLKPFLKTSGGKGLHVVVPIRKQLDWDTVKDVSQAVVAHLAQTIPQRFVMKSGPKNRVGKIFIDYLRNGLGATTVAAWSARARPGLGISVPVDWSELGSLKSGAHWTVQTVHTRLDQGNSPWDAYAKSATTLTKAMKLLDFKPASRA